MKGKILLVFAAMVFALQMQAQLGVHIGYNMAKINGAEVPTGVDEKYLGNPALGVFFEKDIIPLLDIRAGLMYSPKGQHLAQGDDYAKFIINYIELPIEAKVKLGPVYALGGVYGGYGLKAKSKTSIGGEENTEDIDFDDYNLKRFDYGLKFGLGVQVGVGPLHVFAQGDYSMGLQNLNDGEGDEVKNSVIGVHAGVLIGF